MPGLEKRLEWYHGIQSTRTHESMKSKQGACVSMDQYAVQYVGGLPLCPKPPDNEGGRTRGAIKALMMQLNHRGVPDMR